MVYMYRPKPASLRAIFFEFSIKNQFPAQSFQSPRPLSRPLYPRSPLPLPQIPPPLPPIPPLLSPYPRPLSTPSPSSMIKDIIYVFHKNVLFITKKVHIMFQETVSHFCENDSFLHFMLTTLTPQVPRVNKPKFSKK